MDVFSPDFQPSPSKPEGSALEIFEFSRWACVNAFCAQDLRFHSLSLARAMNLTALDSPTLAERAHPEVGAFPWRGFEVSQSGPQPVAIQTSGPMPGQILGDLPGTFLARFLIRREPSSFGGRFRFFIGVDAWLLIGPMELVDAWVAGNQDALRCLIQALILAPRPALDVLGPKRL